jgi:hypothetical protein
MCSSKLAMILEAISEAYKLRRLLWYFLMEILHEEKQRVLSRPVTTQIRIDTSTFALQGKRVESSRTSNLRTLA